MSMYKVLVISLSPPLLVGLYENNKLIKSFETYKKSDQALPNILKAIVENYEIEELLYARGPGSFMSIKVAYILLRTLSIVKGIPLRATNGFFFNDEDPIKAPGNRFFIKKDDSIVVDLLERDLDHIKLFTLPAFLVDSIFSCECEPLYILPAV